MPDVVNARHWHLKQRGLWSQGPGEELRSILVKRITPDGCAAMVGILFFFCFSFGIRRYAMLCMNCTNHMIFFHDFQDICAYWSFLIVDRYCWLYLFPPIKWKCYFSIKDILHVISFGKLHVFSGNLNYSHSFYAKSLQFMLTGWEDTCGGWAAGGRWGESCRIRSATVRRWAMLYFH